MLEGKLLGELTPLRHAALSIFEAALKKTNAGRALRGAIKLQGQRIEIFDAAYDPASARRLYSIAVGKAAGAMASALDEILGERIGRGVISAPAAGAGPLPGRWEAFAGGHPLPNRDSFEAARAAFRLLERASREGATVIFLISGGGSAMIEWPSDPALTLEDLREANRVLVSCGADISEVNGVRRALSAVKGGGLSARAPLAPQVTLIVSDVNAGREWDVASGPTLPPPTDAPRAARVVEKYGLGARLPSSVLRTLEAPPRDGGALRAARASRRHYVLLDNESAVNAAADAARSLGHVVEVAHDIVEQGVEEGSATLVSRLFNLYRREGSEGRGVCLVSGGEFACPVRGAGLGGRNSETALRAAVESEKFFEDGARGARPSHFVALCAGTDGLDGNSPAAGATADDTTLARARRRDLDPQTFLENSDAYSLFDALGDALVTGPTCTNVRDLRILLAE